MASEVEEASMSILVLFILQSRRPQTDSHFQAGLGIYPFTEGKLEDLEEVFEHFKEVSEIVLNFFQNSWATH